MTYPSDRIMLVLDSLIFGREFVVIEDSRGFVEIAKDVLFEVTNDEMDELKSRGWLVVVDDGSSLNATDSGRYWSKRYAKRRQTTNS